MSVHIHAVFDIVNSQERYTNLWKKAKKRVFWSIYLSRKFTFFKLAKFENHRKNQEKMKISKKNWQAITYIRWCLPHMKSRGPLSFDISRKKNALHFKIFDFLGLSTWLGCFFVNTFWWFFLWNLSRFPGFSKISNFEIKISRRLLNGFWKFWMIMKGEV